MLCHQAAEAPVRYVRKIKPLSARNAEAYHAGKPATEAKQSGGSFTNTHVYLDPVSVRGRSGNIWRTWIQQRGGKIAQSVDDRHLTHVIVGESGTTADLPYAKLQAHGVHMVRSAWMEACLAQDKRLPEESFGGGTGTASGGSAGAAVQVSPAKRGHGPLWRYRKWLGKWLPEYDEMTIETEIALQAVFSWDRAQANGNAALVEAFAELYKYEDAVESTLEGADEDINPKDRIDRRALAYARAAAACMGCAFNIGEAVRRGDLDDDDLPFVGDVGARQVKELVLTGTCKELANYRADLAVSTSSGELRPETVGGATRRMFKKLPGVGSHAAYRWYKMGLRSFEDLEAATAGGRNVGLSTDQRFSLQHRANLLEDLPQDELEQMRSVVLDAIAKVRGSREGWRMTVVGGGRRGLPSHDGDFVISHPTESTAGLVRPLCEQLIKDRRMYGAASGMCKIQDTRMATHLDSIREHVEAAGRKGPKDNLLADR
ncbi:hypothetical protein WJX72_010236 [[Myrmecia] bisecta]|uniref:BRCT domain-containing protein n=1 Tax=[Myrmecia] bisecta TaxID=41462 RepID=A0AAW1P788_9CHLO